MLDKNAIGARARLLSLSMSIILDSEKAFFAMVRHEINNFAGHILNSEPAVFEGGWRVLFVSFGDEEDLEFLFALSNKSKGIFAIALDRDPSCPGWLVELAGQMYSYQQL